MANERHKEQEILSKNNPMFSVFRRLEGYRISTIVFAEGPEEMEIWERNRGYGVQDRSSSIEQSQHGKEA